MLLIKGRERPFISSKRKGGKEPGPLKGGRLSRKKDREGQGKRKKETGDVTLVKGGAISATGEKKKTAR